VVGLIPGEDLAGVGGISKRGRVAPIGSGVRGASRAVGADQRVLASHLPVIIPCLVMVLDTGEEAFHAGLVAGDIRGRLITWYQVFSAGKDKDVRLLVVVVNTLTGDALGGLAADTRDAQVPTGAKGPVPGCKPGLARAGSRCDQGAGRPAA
jgi:hypothetical protein